MTRVVLAVLAATSVALAFTQVGFIGVQFADGSSAYLIIMLLPVALAALLLGVRMGAAMGLFAGAMLYVHSVLMPLDYYELVYVTPVTSIVMMCLLGLLLGLLFSLIMTRVSKRLLRAVFVAAACLFVSAVFSAGFALSTIITMTANIVAENGVALTDEQLAEVQAQALAAAMSTGDALFQMVGDAVLMTLVSLLGIVGTRVGLQMAAEADLRTVYGAWLSAVFWLSCMVVATVGYGAITAGALVDAQQDMHDEAEYLLGQVERTVEYNGKVAQYIAATDGDVDAIEELTSGGVLANLLAGYTEEGDGLVVVAVGQFVSGADADRIKGGAVLADCFDDSLLDAAKRSAGDGTLGRVVYEGPSMDSDLVNLALPGSSVEFSDLIARQIGYISAVDDGDCSVFIIRSAGMVFSGRSAVMAWLTVTAFVLLLTMFTLAWQLLDRLVARRVDALNTGLVRITEGELSTRMEVEGTREFQSLSQGINTTVETLQTWIAEAETRMDAELATAKAIQESALPRTFPPYPDILRFDVYASMNAAKEVGGDFYDFFLIGEDCTPDSGKLGFLIADVSGKGVPAALFMMKAKTQLRDYMESGMELGEAVENANRQLCEGNDAGMFVTVWAGILDYASGHLDFVNAGHNPPLLWQGCGEGGPGWRWLEDKSGLPLGLFDGLPYAAHSVDCSVGDELLLYTDGVTEAMSVSDELYGEARLEKLTEANYTLHPRELVEAVRADVAAHAAGAEQSDDITVLVMEVGVPPEITATLTVPADVAELDRVNAFIHTELDRRLCPLRTQKQIDIAVEELFVNVAHYAYENAGEDVARVVRVSYTYSAEPPSVQIDIADDGAPFDPLAKPDASTADEFGSVADIPIGGLGILMTKRSVDELSYERVGNSNVVTLVKKW